VSTDVTEVADGIYRISTFVEPPGLVFNQYLIDAEEPMLWHCGHRQLFPLVAEALGTGHGRCPGGLARARRRLRPSPRRTDGRRAVTSRR
jgi:hypothetical protein